MWGRDCFKSLITFCLAIFFSLVISLWSFWLRRNFLSLEGGWPISRIESCTCCKSSRSIGIRLWMLIISNDSKFACAPAAYNKSIRFFILRLLIASWKERDLSVVLPLSIGTMRVMCLALSCLHLSKNNSYKLPLFSWSDSKSPFKHWSSAIGSVRLMTNSLNLVSLSVLRFVSTMTEARKFLSAFAKVTFWS